MLSAVRSLRSPGLLGQGVRYVLAGGTGVAVYVTTTIGLADVVGVPFQVALAIGFSAGLVVQFTLYRLFVWSHTRSLRCRCTSRSYASSPQLVPTTA